MIKHTNRTFTLSALVALPLVALCACASSSIIRTQDIDSNKSRVDEGEVVTICEIQNNRSNFVGKIVRLHGTYRSDGITWELFQDKSCGDNNSIHLVSFTDMVGDETVESTLKAIKDNCWNLRSGSCENDFILDVRGMITKDDKNRMRIGFLHVYSLKLVNRSNGTE